MENFASHHVALIAILVVAALALAIWIARRGRPGMNDASPQEMAAKVFEAAPAPVMEPVVEATPEPKPVQSFIPPSAPPPPPMAGSDEIIPATAAFEAAPAILAAEEAQPANAPEPDDNLTTLKGLGPKVAAMLAEQGVTRFAQLAALSDAQASDLDAQLGAFQGRMAKDRWIDQAKYLAAGDKAGFESEFGRL